MDKYGDKLLAEEILSYVKFERGHIKLTNYVEYTGIKGTNRIAEVTDIYSNGIIVFKSNTMQFPARVKLTNVVSTLLESILLELYAENYI